jgi:hypothetical protein
MPLAIGEVVGPLESTHLATSKVLHTGLAAGDAVDVLELDLFATPRALERHDAATPIKRPRSPSRACPSLRENLHRLVNAPTGTFTPPSFLTSGTGAKSGCVDLKTVPSLRW